MLDVELFNDFKGFVTVYNKAILNSALLMLVINQTTSSKVLADGWRQ
jgi:hypothetical protein